MRDVDTLHEGNEEQWISISDVMSVTMMIFIFLTVIFMVSVSKDKRRIEQIAVTYNRLQNSLYEDLRREFEDDLPKWDAEINRETLSITFQEPDVLFEKQKAEIKPEFQDILDDFFPRYVKILTGKKYKADIEEVRIEGHTSSKWEGARDQLTAYFKNMELSQRRSRAVLEYVLKPKDALPLSDDSLVPSNSDWPDDWLKRRLTANGLSSSKLVKGEDGSEDRERSRRVEFRVRTNAEKRIVQIVGEKRP